jgi:hypothetical protein
MSGNTAPERDNTSGSSSAPAAGTSAATGYRVSLVPGALEVSARLATAEELRNLVKVLRASIVILDDATEGDIDLPVSLTKRVAEASTRK